MRGHSQPVNAVAFFDDGRRVVTGSDDKTLGIWDVQKGALVGEPFKEHRSSIESVAVFPRGRRIASGGRGKTVVIWDIENKHHPLVKHTAWVWSVCFSPDGKKLASGSSDSTVVVWDAETGTVLATLRQCFALVLTVAFSPDGLKIASGSSDHTIRIWRTDDSELILHIDAHQNWVRSIVWSPDGQHLVSASHDKSVKFWDASNGDQIGQPCTGHTHWIRSLAISSDGSLIATASYDRTVRLWSTTTRQQIGEALEHANEVYCVAISPNDALLASGGQDSNVYLWSIADVLKRHDARDTQQQRHIVSSNLKDVAPVLPLSHSDGLTHSSANSSSVGSICDVHVVPPETTVEIDRAGNGREKSKEDADLRNVFSRSHLQGVKPLQQQLREVHATSSSCEAEGNTYPDAHSSTELEYATIAAPRVPLVQAAFDSYPSVPGETMLQGLTDCITNAGDCPVAHGGFGQIWKCTYQRAQGPVEVAVKALLAYASDQLGEVIEKKNKRIRQEVRKCAKLKHRNILPVYGYTYGFGFLVSIVSAWVENGNLTTYLEHESTALNMVRRFQLLRDITSGLQYLHANNVIHGALNGPNVLIHGDGKACLTDFGLFVVYSEVMTTSTASWTYAFHGNVQWLAPELLGDPQDKVPIRPSKHSDIYSFGGIMLQVLTSKIPYYYLDEAAAIQRIVTGIKPLRSHYPTVRDKYWRLIKICWSDVAQSRPSAEEVVEWIGDEVDSLFSSGSDS